MILLYQPFQNRTIPLLCTITLASLVKGRWIDGKAQTVALLRLFAIYPPFLFTKLFCRQDGGIAFLPHPFRFSDTSVNNPSIVGSASHCNRSSPLHKGAKGDTALPTFPKPHYPSKITITLALLASPVAPNTAIPTTIAKEQQSLTQHFPHKPKRPHLITGAVLLILNLTSSQDYHQAN